MCPKVRTACPAIRTAANVPLSILPKVLLSLLQGMQSSLSGTYSKYASSALILFTSLAGVVITDIGCVSVSVLFALTVILFVVGMLMFVLVGSQAVHLQGVTGI